MSNHACIILKAAGLMVQHEFKAAETLIYPGHLIEASAAGSSGIDACLRDNRASTVGAPVIVAIENDYLGGTKDTVYANGDIVYGRALTPGSEVQVRLAAAAAAVVFNDSLTRQGDGRVKKAAAADEIIGVALEAVDNSGGATDVFIRMRAR